MSPKITAGMSMEALLDELGRRLKALRMSRRITQDALARAAGLSRATLTRMENGQGGDLRNFLAVLSALDRTGLLEVLLPEAPISPIELLKRAGNLPRRVGTPRKPGAQGKRPFKWGDEQ
jgi:putative transcriptional regulator